MPRQARIVNSSEPTVYHVISRSTLAGYKMKMGTGIKILKLLTRIKYHVPRISNLRIYAGGYQDTLISVLDSFIKHYKFEELAQN